MAALASTIPMALSLLGTVANSLQGSGQTASAPTPAPAKAASNHTSPPAAAPAAPAQSSNNGTASTGNSGSAGSAIVSTAALCVVSAFPERPM